MKIGIIGTNLMGKRRAAALKAFPADVITKVSSGRFERAQAFVKEFGGEAVRDWRDVADASDVDAVIICTPNHLHAEIALAALKAGKHVLCEKPLARTLEEAESLVKAATLSKKVLKCGFNHRYHPGVFKAKQIVDKGEIGKIHFIRARYGICGRPDYSQEWRMNADQVGGGHLMEHGIHVIDLFRWFMGDIDQASGFTASYVVKAGDLEDNAFALFKSKKGSVAQLHSSLTQWRNMFSFEVFGDDGYVTVEGLGGSYGTEKINQGVRSFDKPFEDKSWEFRGDDTSWKDEWKDFSDAINLKRTPLGDAKDGLEAMKLVMAVYESNASGKWSSLS